MARRSRASIVVCRTASAQWYSWCTCASAVRHATHESIVSQKWLYTLCIRCSFGHVIVMWWLKARSISAINSVQICDGSSYSILAGIGNSCIIVSCYLSCFIHRNNMWFYQETVWVWLLRNLTRVGLMFHIERTTQTTQVEKYAYSIDAKPYSLMNKGLPTLCLKKTTLMLHTITSTHINRFW